MSDNSEPRSRPTSTEGLEYAERLNQLQNKWWKKIIPVQAPYRWNMRRRLHGRTLDVGCGNGRNLGALTAGSVGVDHNPHLVAACREQGLEAYTVDELFADPSLSAPGSYDSLLAAHLVEHMDLDEAVETSLVRASHSARGTVLLITPQERGFASDPTHVEFADFEALELVSSRSGLVRSKRYSFPFPRSFGKFFIYNKFNHVARVPVPTENSAK